ncbi:14075_t:CDS:2, partial [Funneliformis geosporum]
AKKGEVKQLLKQLESNFNHSESSETLPFYAQIGLGMGAVLLVTNKEEKAIVSRQEALNQAKSLGLDLLCVSPSTNPP